MTEQKNTSKNIRRVREREERGETKNVNEGQTFLRDEYRPI